jgi:hypothetical protein
LSITGSTDGLDDYFPAYRPSRSAIRFVLKLLGTVLEECVSLHREGHIKTSTQSKAGADLLELDNEDWGVGNEGYSVIFDFKPDMEEVDDVIWSGDTR